MRRAFNAPMSRHWAQVDPAAVTREILERAGIADGELLRLQGLANEAETAFKRAKTAALPILDAVVSNEADPRLAELRDGIEDSKSALRAQDVIVYLRPQQVMSRDSQAMHQGLQVPPHIAFLANLMHYRSKADNVRSLSEQLNRVARYMEARGAMAKGGRAGERPDPLTGAGLLNMLPVVLDFTILDGNAFEDLVYGYLLESKEWKGSQEWNEPEHYGGPGDGGRDIWLERKDGTATCFLCANHEKLKAKKVYDDLEKLAKLDRKPNSAIVVTGRRRVTPTLRDKAQARGEEVGIPTKIWSGREFESMLRENAPKLTLRVFGQRCHPEAP